MYRKRLERNMVNFLLGIIFGWRGFDDFVFYLRFYLHVL